jgi:hypothetical protein
MHLLVSELYIYQNARCNDKNYKQGHYSTSHKTDTAQTPYKNTNSLTSLGN